MANKVEMYIDLERVYNHFEKCEQKTKKFVSDVLIQSKKIVTEKLMRDTIKSNMPAKGIFWTGDLRSSINIDHTITWQGYIGHVNVGYDFKKSGMKSLAIIYGTPTMKPAKKLRDDIYGSATKKEIKQLQNDMLAKLLGGD